MPHGTASGNSRRQAKHHPAETTTLELIREKERELTQLIAAARREAAQLVAGTRERAEYLIASAASEARTGADDFLRQELAAVDREAEAIAAQAGEEVETVRRTPEERLLAAVELVCRCVVPASSREEER